MPFDMKDVRRAFLEDEFFPLFQPLIMLRTGQLAGFEVLARWNHLRLGPIHPDAFIPILQKSGLINTLTQRILKKAFAAAHLLPQPMFLSVNLSPHQLLDCTLPGQIEAAAEQGSFALDRLTIEIPESALLEEISRVRDVALGLKALHCRLSLDDFGTGHSNLSHIHELPFDELKVDRSFVQTMSESPGQTKIVAAVLGFGQSFGLTTVAEGVETEEHASVLNWLGCDMAQGWLYGKPGPAEEISGIVSAPVSPRLAVLPEPIATDSASLIEELKMLAR